MEKKVLVIEDNDLVRDLLKRMFSHLQFNVIVLGNYDDLSHLSLDLIREFDLVVTDYHLPNNRTGADVISLIQSVDVSLPIILISGDLTETEAKQFGVAFLSKPIRLEDLEQCAHSLIGMRRSETPPT